MQHRTIYHPNGQLYVSELENLKIWRSERADSRKRTPIAETLRRGPWKPRRTRTSARGRAVFEWL